MKWSEGLNRALLLPALAGLMFTVARAKADFVFGPPTNLGGIINSSSHDLLPNISADGLSLYFTSDRTGGQGDRDLWVATRPVVRDDWQQCTNLGSGVNSPYSDESPCISSDGLELYFNSSRPGGYGDGDLWVTTRATINDTWCTPVNLGPPINSVAAEYGPNLSADGLSLHFVSQRSGGLGGGDIWVSTRASRSAPWREPSNLGPAVNGPYHDGSPSLSYDGLVLFFASWRPDDPGFNDMYICTRATTADEWNPAVNLGRPINTDTEDGTPSISSDGLTLYFASLRGGGHGGGDIWQVPIIPLVDFNGDGAVDTDDIVRMIKSWGEDDPGVDIGPMPWGDHTVGSADLEVLMSYWGREVNDLTLVAHWAFDELDGYIASDEAGHSDGMVVGVSAWQPGDGRIGGAMHFDGATLVSTDAVMNPAEGPFSVFAWVKGGAPGQVVLSQQGGANWLLPDPDTGALMTELKSGGRSSSALYSDMTITDGTWHRVGFTWDGTNRSLYVDDVLVAYDTQQGLAACRGGLQIGCGKDVVSGTFWSGLIDDVRIYSRVVKP